MKNKTPIPEAYKFGFVLSFIVLIIAVFFLLNSFVQQSANQKNKEIAIQVIHHGLETGEVDALASQYFDQNIQIEFPPAFHFPPDHLSTVTGIENVKTVVKAWKADTAHQVDIVDAVSDNNEVSVLTSQDRIFKVNNETLTYENHPAMYYFYFKDGKITRVVGVFDVLDQVEEFKDNKYQ